MTLDLAHIISLSFNAALIILLQIERHRAAKREQELVEAVMANNLTEYHNNPKNQIKIMEKESKLAEDAYKLESLYGKTTLEPGYPVT